MSELFITAKCWKCKRNYIFGLCVFILSNVTGIYGIITLLNKEETPYTKDYNVIFVTFTCALLFISAIIFRCICISFNKKTEEEEERIYYGYNLYNDA